MGTLASILVPTFLKEMFAASTHLFEAYQNKQITLAQLQQQLGVIAMQSFVKVAEANADMVKATFGAYSQMVMNSRLVQVIYAVVVLSQTFVLFWSQWAVPYLVWTYGGTYPSAGETLFWAYGLIVLLCGGGIVAIRQPKQPAIPTKE